MVATLREGVAKALINEKLLVDEPVVILLPQFVVSLQIHIPEVLVRAHQVELIRIKHMAECHFGIFGKPPQGVVDVDKHGGDALHFFVHTAKVRKICC